MSDVREHLMTGDRVAEIRARLEAAHSHASPALVIPRTDLAYLLAEVAALRGRLAAVEAVSDQLWEWKDGIELAGELRAALASEEDA